MLTACTTETITLLSLRRTVRTAGICLAVDFGMSRRLTAVCKNIGLRNGAAKSVNGPAVVSEHFG